MPAAKKKTSRPKGAKTKAGAARKRAAHPVSLPDALALAAWAEADAALASALADLDEAETAVSAAARAEALTMLAQSLTQAARKRGLARIGQLGAREAFDAARHDLIQAGVKKPKTVRIAARGVARGGEVLTPPRVRADRPQGQRKKK